MCALGGVLIKWFYEIHSTAMKIVNAQQAELNNSYKNTKLKLLKKTNQSVYFKNVTLL